MRTPKRANIENLTNLWQRMGAVRQHLGGDARLHISAAWPHRRWLDWDVRLTEPQVDALCSTLQHDRSAVVPVWSGEDDLLPRGLRRAGFEPTFTQIAMRRPRRLPLQGGPGDLVLVDVTAESLVKTWTRTASVSFGYAIDMSVVQGLVGTPGLDMFVAMHRGETVGTALLFEDAGALGVHMVGVHPLHRRRGLGRKIMFGLLRRARDARVDDVVLHSSEMGEPLYNSMDFERQFPYSNFSIPLGR